MVQLHFGPRDRLLYGVYDPAIRPRRRRGAVILNPLGWEALRAHRTLRVMASRLSASGIDVMRFDYSGSGDSFGEPVDCTFAAWLDDAEFALDELLASSGLARATLIGLRMGALVAGELAARRSRLVDGLVLWEPPAAGAEVVEWAKGAPGAEVSAFPFPRALESDLSGRSLPTFFSGRVLVVSSHPARFDYPRARTFETLLVGSNVAPCWVEDRDRGAGAVPTSLVEHVVEWIASSGPGHSP